MRQNWVFDNTGGCIQEINGRRCGLLLSDALQAPKLWMGQGFVVAGQLTSALVRPSRFAKELPAFGAQLDSLGHEGQVRAGLLAVEAPFRGPSGLGTS